MNTMSFAGIDTFQSTLSVRRATRRGRSQVKGEIISIHALRKESDGSLDLIHGFLHISIHALRKESDPGAAGKLQEAMLFQSTLSVRRATRPVQDHGRGLRISIHALRKESDRSISAAVLEMRISIHALRKESDVVWPGETTASPHFNPRSP